MHRGVVFASRRPPNLVRSYIELICWALVYILRKAPPLIGSISKFRRFATCAARRGPRLAQGVEKTLLLRCAIEGTYQDTTSRKRTGRRADLTVPRPRAARAVQIDFRRSGVKRFKRGAFSRRASREHVAIPRSPFELVLRSRRPTPRGAAREAQKSQN